MTISPLRLAVFLLLTGLLAWAAYDYQRDQLVETRAELAGVTAELQAKREAARLAEEQLAARDQLDTRHTQELTRALTENLDLRRAVDAGRQRLRIKAVCPGMPNATGATGLADGNTAELATNARSDYFTLRDELARSRQMILGLQDYIRLVVQRTPAKP